MFPLSLLGVTWAQRAVKKPHEIYMESMEAHKKAEQVCAETEKQYKEAHEAYGKSWNIPMPDSSNNHSAYILELLRANQAKDRANIELLSSNLAKDRTLLERDGTILESYGTIFAEKVEKLVFHAERVHSNHFTVKILLNALRMAGNDTYIITRETTELRKRSSTSMELDETRFERYAEQSSPSKLETISSILPCGKGIDGILGDSSLHDGKLESLKEVYHYLKRLFQKSTKPEGYKNSEQKVEYDYKICELSKLISKCRAQ